MWLYDESVCFDPVCDFFQFVFLKYFAKGPVTNYGQGGGYKTGGGGAREVLPLQKGGAEKVLAILKEEHKKF